MFSGMFLLAAAAPEAVPISSDLPSWTQMLVTVLSLVITAFVLPYLKQKAAAAKAEAENNSTAAACNLQSARSMLIERLNHVALEGALAIGEREFPKLAREIATGKIKTQKQVKDVLYSWGKNLRDHIIDSFRKEGLDIIAAVGDDYLDKLIEKVANKVSPFPGRETAVHMLQANVSDWLIAQGVNYVRGKYMNADKFGTETMLPVSTEAIMAVERPDPVAPADAPTDGEG